MMLTGPWAVFGCGMLGPLLMELVKIGAWQRANPRLFWERYRSLPYWFATAALFVAGGIVAVLNGVDHVPAMRAVQLGIAAPATIAGLATALQPRPGKGSGMFPDSTSPRTPWLLELLSW